jgi:glycerol-3-phosphate O-acyltransferase / dihydroxyacetone phosphate acyltransferase
MHGNRGRSAERAATRGSRANAGAAVGPLSVGPASGRPASGGLGRRGLSVATAALARLLARVFFREIEVEGADRIPRDRPLLIVANHVNSLVDPILILGFLGVRPRFLAKSTLWSHPVIAPLLLFSGALPVYRRQDAGEDPGRNVETFARCRDQLARGGTIAVFPEGASHNQPHGLPLKTGAARIALEAEQAHGPLGIRIVPVGITYEDKDRFRSRVLIRVGMPIDPSPEIRLGTEAARRVTARIAAALEQVALPFASWGEARLVDQALALVRPDVSEAPLSQLVSLRATAVDRYRRLLLTDPAEAARLAAAIARSAPDPSVLGSEAAARRLRSSRARRALLAIPALVGAVLNVVPLRIPGWIGDRLTRTPDEPATYKILAALLTFPLFWALEVAAAAMLGWPFAIAMAAAAPLTGYVALLYRDHARDAAELRQRRRIAVAEAASPQLLEERSRLRDWLLELSLPRRAPLRTASEDPGRSRSRW